MSNPSLRKAVISQFRAGTGASPADRSVPRGPTSTWVPTNYGLIVAAGQGTRYGGYKQLVPLAGEPVLVHSVRAFERCPMVSGIVVVGPPRRMALVRRLLSSRGTRKLLGIVRGGETRAESVRAGLALLPSHGFVAIHDAARPIIHPGMLSKGLRACRSRGAATYGHPVTDTLKRTDGKDVVATVDRSLLIAVQTPQFFSIELLRRAHEAASKTHSEATDDCELVERLGVRPIWLPGPRTNMKLTTRDDLVLIRALV
ncbi:2-C-methyl-D-erythritol 4-phosphate cytidylyltransferase [candidate division WOR-3 bacterium]|nr:2-C-methyl-D-erythritol 4-phosphate cytidylyltransferase [candidate division WOR-3 bacterium]